MVITDPNFIAAASADLRDLAAAQQSGSGGNPSAQVQTPFSNLTADQQQAVRQVVQSLGVSSKLLDQLTAALGGSAEPFPDVLALPAGLDLSSLETETIALITRQILGSGGGGTPAVSQIQADSSGRSALAEPLEEAGRTAAHQILNTLRQIEAAAIKDRPGSAGHSQNKSAPLSGPSHQAQLASTAAEVNELALELNNFLQTAIWLRSAPQNGNAEALSDPAAAAGPYADRLTAAGVSRLLVLLQLTGGSPESAAPSASNLLERAISTSLGGSNSSSAQPYEQSAAAALLADPEGAELLTTISRSLQVVSRLLEKAAPAQTAALRLALADLGSVLNKLNPPPPYNPSAVRIDPPELIREELAASLQAVRSRIDAISNQSQSSPAIDQTAAGLPGWLDSFSGLLRQLTALSAQNEGGKIDSFRQIKELLTAELKTQLLLLNAAGDIDPRLLLSAGPAESAGQQQLASLLQRLAAAGPNGNRPLSGGSLQQMLELQPHQAADALAAQLRGLVDNPLAPAVPPALRLIKEFISASRALAAKLSLPAGTAADSASSSARLAETLKTIEQRGLELVLHQISFLNGNEQAIGDLQLALEQDSFTATAAQTAQILQRNIAASGLSDNSKQSIEVALAAIYQLLSSTKGEQAPAANKVEAALAGLKQALNGVMLIPAPPAAVESSGPNSFAAASAAKQELPAAAASVRIPAEISGAVQNFTVQTSGAGVPAAGPAPAMTNLQIALVSLLEQQLTGITLYSSGQAAGDQTTALYSGFAAAVPAGLPSAAAGADLAALLRLLLQTEAPRNALLSQLLNNLQQPLSQLPGALPLSSSEQLKRLALDLQQAIAGSSDRDISRAVPPAVHQVKAVQETAGQAGNDGLNRLPAAAGTPAAEQVKTLTKSVALQLDLLAEQNGLPAGKHSGAAASTIQPANDPLLGSNFFRFIPAQSNSPAAGQNNLNRLAGPASAAVWLDPVSKSEEAASALGARFDSLLTRIDQLRSTLHSPEDQQDRAKSGDGRLLELLHHTAHRLKDLTADSAKPFDSTELQAAAAKLESACNELAKNNKTAQPQTAVSEAIRQLETLIRGQEALSCLNPVMQALGEPTFILFPGIIHGMMVRVEMLLYPQVDPDAGSRSKDRGKNRKKGNEEKESDSPSDSQKRREAAEKHSYRRFKVGLRLPYLGQVAVDFAHTLQEALIGISVENDNAAAEVESSFPQLITTFRALGYKNIDLSIKPELNGDLQPNWLQELLRINAISA